MLWFGLSTPLPLDKRSFPKRALIVIGATVVGFLLGLFVAVVQAGLEQLKADAETYQKFNLLRRELSFRNWTA